LHKDTPVKKAIEKGEALIKMHGKELIVNIS